MVSTKCPAFVVVSRRQTFYRTWESVLCRLGSTRRADSIESLHVAPQGESPSLVIADARLVDSICPSLIVGWLQHCGSARLLVADTVLAPIDELSILAAGAVGCCDISLRPEELLGIVDVALRNSVWVSKAAVPLLMSKLRGIESSVTTLAVPSRTDEPENLQALTERQREVARMVAHGANNKQIGRVLNISDRTVKFHMSGIFDKLGISDRTQLALHVAGKHH